MSSNPPKLRMFDHAALQRGLKLLGELITESEVLAPFRPIEMVASGGFVSVTFLQNRKASQDCDYFLNARAFGTEYEKVRMELQKLISIVAERLKYEADWANDDVRLFLTLLNDAEALFDQSRAQRVVLYEDNSLIIFAVLWEWVLVQKLKRLQMDGVERPRREDWSDCVAITKLLYDKNGGPLSTEVLRAFDQTEREPPVLEKTLSDLRRVFIHLYTLDPFEAPSTNAFQSGVWVYSSQTMSFVHRLRNGATIPQDQWPAMRGRVRVYMSMERTWKTYNFDTQSWE